MIKYSKITRELDLMNKRYKSECYSPFLSAIVLLQKKITHFYCSIAFYRYRSTLQSYGIKLGETPLLPDVDVKLPPLKGTNLMEHFYEIAQEQLQPYKQLIESLALTDIPPMPKSWKMVEGWTRYDRDGNAVSVPYPEDNALIFDIEVCMREGNRNAFNLYFESIFLNT